MSHAADALLRDKLMRLPPPVALDAALLARVTEQFAPADGPVVDGRRDPLIDGLSQVDGASAAAIVPATTPLPRLAADLQKAGWRLTRWFSFYAPAAAAYAAMGYSARDRVLHALTGHYVLTPWPRYLDPLVARLAPFVRAPIGDDGVLLWLELRRESVDEVTPGADLASLPQPDTLGAAAELAAADAHRQARLGGTGGAESGLPPGCGAPPRGDETSADPLPINPRRPTFSADIWLPLAVLGAVLAALAAQAALRGAPEAPAGALPWLLAIGGAMLAVRRLYDRREADAGDNRRPVWRRRYALVPFGWLLALLAAQAGPRPALALPLWLLGIAIAAYGAGLPAAVEQRVAARRPLGRATVAALAVTGLALALRAVAVTRHPFLLTGTEASLALDAVGVMQGRLNNLFATGWLTHPLLPAFLQSVPVRLLGQTVLAARLPAVVYGTVTVWLTFAVGRRLWRAPEGLMAALLLAGAHAHIHYSRLGTLQTWDTLLLLAAVGGAAAAWQRPSRLRWLAAGAAAGMAAYGYTSLRLLPAILGGFFLLMATFDLPGLRRQARHLAAAAGVAVTVALPQLLFYLANPTVLYERLATQSIVASGWLAEAVRAGGGPGAVWAEQWRQAALAFHATLDRDLSYGAQIPLATLGIGALLLIGAGMALFHLDQPRYAALLVWLLVTIGLAGALLRDPPQSRHLVTALPAVVLLAARAAVWLVEKGVRGWQWRAWPAGAALLLLGCLLIVPDVSYYFGRYRDGLSFADRNSEAAFVLANYMNTLPPASTVYLHGAPSLYTSFSTLPYLVSSFEVGRNFFDVVDVTAPDAVPATAAETVVHVVLPERSADLAVLETAAPGGALQALDGRYSRPLFTVYRYSR